MGDMEGMNTVLTVFVAIAVVCVVLIVGSLLAHSIKNDWNRPY